MTTTEEEIAKRKEQKERDKVLVPELFKLAADYVEYQIKEKDAHPEDAALNAQWLIESYIEVRIG